MILTIVTFIIILALLVLSHEFGHFIAAKKAGVKVEEFAFGFPPRLFSIKKGETTYTINTFFFLGGYVKMLGELEESKSKRALENQPAYKRLIISLAGILMNIVLAWVLLVVGFSVGMSPVISPSDQVPGKRLSNQIIIADFENNSPAKSAGLAAGDIIKEIDSSNTTQNVGSFSDLTNFTQAYYGQKVTVVYERDGAINKQEVSLSGSSDAPLGVGLIERSIIRVPLYDAPWVAAREEYRIGIFTFEFLGNYLHNLFTTGQAGEGVGGPVAIYTYTGLFVRMGILALLQFVALLSINLAILNILPIPALDGGRILFILIEMVARRRLIREYVENIIHSVGFVFLLLLIALITYGDIIHLIRK
ncbi:MAG: site-2 protease family protein [Patescibacteria group bacterium]|jgi:regulator of sigma E protease